MSSYSAFDIAGPIMVGPSSSHTAGAVKLGQIARALFDATPEKVTFYLHGSFASVCKGHATDRALVAGVLKFHTSDPRIKDSFKIAGGKGIKFEFKLTDLGIAYHPNTVKIVLEKGKKKMEVIGSSVGGGDVVIKKINEFEVSFTGTAGKYHTLIIFHQNRVGVLSEITTFIAKRRINIANIQNSRLAKGGKAITILNLDSSVSLEEIWEMEKIPGISYVRSLYKIAGRKNKRNRV